jgi:cytochrome c oxidase subunit 4
MATDRQTIDTGLYDREKGMYLKILIGLLVLTALTFVQPFVLFKHATFEIQLLIAVAKAFLIVAFYMHLKSEKPVIGLMVTFAMILVVFFFTTTLIDVSNFQFADESFITTGIHK